MDRRMRLVAVLISRRFISKFSKEGKKVFLGEWKRVS